MIFNKILVLSSILFFCGASFAQSPGQKTRHPDKGEIIRKMRDLHGSQFSGDLFSEKINFAPWSGKAGLFKQVKRFVKERGHRDGKLLSAFTSIERANTAIEFAIRDVRDQRAMGHTDPRLSMQKFRRVSEDLQEIGNQLRAMEFRFFHAKDKDEARDVLESLVSYVDSIAVTASRQLGSDR